MFCWTTLLLRLHVSYGNGVKKIAPGTNVLAWGIAGCDGTEVLLPYYRQGPKTGATIRVVKTVHGHTDVSLMTKATPDEGSESSAQQAAYRLRDLALLAHRY